MKLLAGLGAGGGNSEPPEEGRQKLVGVRDRTDGEDQEADGEGEDRLVDVGGRERLEAIQLQRYERHPDAHADPEGHLAGERGEGDLLGPGGAQHHQHDREREAVVEAAFHVEEPAQAPRHLLAPHDGGGEDGIGGAQRRAHEHRLRPLQTCEAAPQERRGT